MAVAQKAEHRVALCLSNCTPRYRPTLTVSRASKGHFYTHASNSTIASRQKVATAQVPITDEQRSKRWSIHTVEYYSATKRNEALPHVTTGTNLGNVK